MGWKAILDAQYSQDQGHGVLAVSLPVSDDMRRGVWQDKEAYDNYADTMEERENYKWPNTAAFSHVLLSWEANGLAKAGGRVVFHGYARHVYNLRVT